MVKSLFGKYDEVPDEWESLKLSEIVSDPISYGVLVPDPDPNGVPMIRSGELDAQGGIERNIIRISKNLEEKYKKTRLRGGELLVSLVGYTGQVTLVPSRFNGYNVSRALGVIRLKTGYDNRFFYYYLLSNSIQKKILNESIGSAQPVINLEKLRKLSILCPPLPEQQKIASILSNIDALIQHTQNLIKQTQKLKKGLMQKLLTEGIDHSKFKILTFIPKYLKVKVPSDWAVMKLDDLTSRSISYGVVVHEEDPNGVPMIISGRIKTEGEIENNLIYIKKEIEEKYKRTRLQDGDILISVVGIVGNIALVSKKFHGYNISRNLAIIRLKNNFVPEFYAQLLKSEIMQKKILVTSIGSVQPTINLSELTKFPMVVPTESEQKKIVQILSNVTKKIDKFIETKSNLENLKKGLMQKLLTGQIRVKV